MSRQHRARAFRGALCAIALALTSLLDSAAAPGMVAVSTAPSAAVAPQLGAQAAFVVDLSTGIQLYAANADTPLPPASTMKIITALVVATALDPDAQVTIEAADIPDQSVFSNMTLQPGDVLTVRDLLYGLLMQSAGDAALALARASGLQLEPGSPEPVARFVQEMNAWAIANGMAQSRFSNPLGVDDPQNQYVTARDLVRATRLLLRDWLLARIVGTQSTVIEVAGPNPRQIELFTTNELLARDDVFGVKTGTEELAGQCLVAGFWRGDNQIISVVLGSPDRYADTQALMDFVDGQYRWLALGAAAGSLGATDALAAQGLSFRVRKTVLMTSAQLEQVVWEILPDAEPRANRHGTVAFSIDGRVFLRIPVYSTVGAAPSAAPVRRLASARSARGHHIWNDCNESCPRAA